MPRRATLLQIVRRVRSRPFWALQDVSFEITAGESVGIVGANGAGKTTLLRLVCGLARPTTGSVRVDERVAALLGEMWTRGAENLWCISFDHAAIRKLRSLDAALPLGYLYPPGQEEFVAPDDTVQAYCPHYQTPIARPDQVQRAHDLGKFVFVWTVNTREDMLAVAGAGVDGMVSDRPSLLLSTFNA